jgi:hypothetical protein
MKWGQSKNPRTLAGRRTARDLTDKMHIALRWIERRTPGPFLFPDGSADHATLILWKLVDEPTASEPYWRVSEFGKEIRDQVREMLEFLKQHPTVLEALRDEARNVWCVANGLADPDGKPTSLGLAVVREHWPIVVRERTDP